MNNQLLKPFLKFGLFLGVFDIIVALTKSYAYNPQTMSQPGLILSGILSLLSTILVIVFIAMAHYDFNKKNDYYISFNDAILIGLSILGISFIISTSYKLINYEVIKDKVSFLSSSHYGIKTILLKSIGLLAIKIVILFIVITAESCWKIFKKAGKEGWAAIIPVYNIVVLLEIIKKPGWWLVMLLIPVVNIIFAMWIANLLAEKFNKDVNFTLGLIFLPFIFYPLLGMSKAEYINNYLS